MLAGWFARRYFFFEEVPLGDQSDRRRERRVRGRSGGGDDRPAVGFQRLRATGAVDEFAFRRRSDAHAPRGADVRDRIARYGRAAAASPAWRRCRWRSNRRALMEYRGRQAMVTVRGVADGYDRVVPVAECITAGDYAVRLGDLDRLVVGRGVAYELGLRSLGESDGVLYAPAPHRILVAAARRGLHASAGGGGGGLRGRRPDRRSLSLYVARGWRRSSSPIPIGRRRPWSA